MDVVSFLYGPAVDQIDKVVCYKDNRFVEAYVAYVFQKNNATIVEIENFIHPEKSDDFPPIPPLCDDTEETIKEKRCDEHFKNYFNKKDVVIMGGYHTHQFIERMMKYAKTLQIIQYNKNDEIQMKTYYENVSIINTQNMIDWSLEVNKRYKGVLFNIGQHLKSKLIMEENENSKKFLQGFSNMEGKIFDRIKSIHNREISIDTLIYEGGIQLKEVNRAINKCLENTIEGKIHGFNVRLGYCSYNIIETTKALSKGYEIGLSMRYHISNDPKIPNTTNLTFVSDEIDVHEIAKLIGGAGSKITAGACLIGIVPMDKIFENFNPK